MARRLREKSGTGIYHVMLRGINRQDIFEDEEDYMQMTSILRGQSERYDEQGMIRRTDPVIPMYNNERKIIVNTYMKSKILRKIATSLLCMLLCSCTEGCDEKYVDITIYNNSSESIYVTYMMSSTPDYIISSRDINYKDLYLVIKPFESYKFRWVEEQLRCYILHLLIIKSSTMDSYDDKSFYEADDIYDKRYALSYGDLEKMGFIIEYRDDG